MCLFQNRALNLWGSTYIQTVLNATRLSLLGSISQTATLEQTLNHTTPRKIVDSGAFIVLVRRVLEHFNAKCKDQNVFDGEAMKSQAITTGHLNPAAVPVCYGS
jgi:hypothetical protein